jgi:hypothetical protein
MKSNVLQQTNIILIIIIGHIVIPFLKNYKNNQIAILYCVSCFHLLVATGGT